MMSLEKLLGQDAAHSHASLDGSGAEVSLAHLPSRGSFVYIQLGH
jgi:hypothetical protein